MSGESWGLLVGDVQQSLSELIRDDVGGGLVGG